MADEDKTPENENETEESTEESAEPEFELDEEGNPVLDEEGNPVPKKAKSKKKLFIICGGVGGLALIGTILFLFVLKPSPEPEDTTGTDITNAGTPIVDGPPVMKDMPSMNINLLTDRGNRFLKLNLTLEYAPPVDDAVFLAVQPRLQDDLNVYLRQRRPDDFKGTGKIYKLKEDLLLRLGQSSHPLLLKNILFRELVVQ